MKSLGQPISETDFNFATIADGELELSSVFMLKAYTALIETDSGEGGVLWQPNNIDAKTAVNSNIFFMIML